MSYELANLAQYVSSNSASAMIATQIASLNLTSGTYTPTLTNVANLDDSTAFQCQFLRVGSVVTVSGRCQINPTTAGVSTTLRITLPIASNFGDTEDCGGTAICNTFLQAMAIYGDTTNNAALMEGIAQSDANRSMLFSFTYRII